MIMRSIDSEDPLETCLRQCPNLATPKGWMEDGANLKRQIDIS